MEYFPIKMDKHMEEDIELTLNWYYIIAIVSHNQVSYGASISIIPAHETDNESIGHTSDNTSHEPIPSKFEVPCTSIKNARYYLSY